ncbi:MAG: PEP-CTERM sorting domain-containing protein [Oscillatoriaceae cyanobacterium Prado104]|nr:PEP-CTERM sorting domain-containing protein [Oscillatoriaceae cyanobacterium Prado104]
MTAIRTLSIAAAGFALISLTAASKAQAATITLNAGVPGTADPWLAGMPDGTIASRSPVRNRFSLAPRESPVLVSNLPLAAGTILTFGVSGSVNYKSVTPIDTPDGDRTIAPHTAGAENGISDISAPRNSLLGVFLDDGQPNLSPAPSALNFSTPDSRNYLQLAPLLKQVFFIGDGRTNQGVLQQILVPEGASRFYLGTMDAYDWSDNAGILDVDVTGTYEVTGGVDPSPSPSPFPSPSPTPAPTPSPAPTPAPSPSPEPAPSPSPEPTPAPSPSPEPAPSPSPEPTPAPAPEPTPAPSPSPEPAPSPSPEPTPAPSPSPEPAPSPSPEPAPAPSPSPEPTPAPAPTPAPSPSPAPTPSPTPESVEPLPTDPEAVAVPEPATVISSFLGLGILGAGARHKRKQKQKSSQGSDRA